MPQLFQQVADNSSRNGSVSAFGTLQSPGNHLQAFGC